ncbi:MAG: hypothetical protein LBQ66_06130 [Planctomycetaceae bacterium]|jgi:hypothetical protein|nr:hypothetical protein [Planctomycetaceae bacterium]
MIYCCAYAETRSRGSFGIFFIFLFLFVIGVVAADEISFPVLPRVVKEVDKLAVVEADKCYRDALLSAESGNINDAIQEAILGITKNPNHKELREFFGYRLYEDEWRLNWEIKRLQDYADHPQFGWIRKEHVKRYESGERPINAIKWGSINDANSRRAKIRDGWKISTPHYEIVTNHSLEEGITKSRELEHLYNAWQFLMIGCLNNDAKIKNLFQKKSQVEQNIRHKVTIYRDKNDYVVDLSKVDSGIAKSNGYYLPRLRQAYFFVVSPEADDLERGAARKVLLHEASHQLFYEPRSTSRTGELAGSRCNFFLVEGLAMFMETLRIKNDQYILGDITDERLYAAKYNVQKLNFYVPFAWLAKMGVNEFQSQEELAKYYSQSAAMTHFLIFANDGKYRNAFFKLIRQIHLGIDKPDALAKLTGCSCEELDKQYKKYLNKIPDTIDENKFDH